MTRNRGGLALALLLVVAAQAVVVDTVAAASARVGKASGAVDCARPARGFTPTVAQLPSLGKTVRVIQVRRTSDNAVGAGPVTEGGKWLMAMDPHTKPASRKGSVLLSGHTWPDGSALGNAMLRNLNEGNRVILYGSNGKRACYRISQRVSYPANKVPKNAFRYWGAERVVIVACSGTRLGPGNWTRRTVWYASPILPAPPAPPKSDPPPAAPPPSLLGGLLSGLLGG